MARSYHIAIVGATGAVGVETLEVLERRSFSAASIKLLASDRSAGKKLPFRGQLIEVEALVETSFVDRDLAFFGAGAEKREIAINK